MNLCGKCDENVTSMAATTINALLKLKTVDDDCRRQTWICIWMISRQGL